MDVWTRHMSGPGEMQRREKTMAGFTTTSRELSLHEMLADPIVQTVMARDGVTKQDVEALIETVRDKMAGRQMEEHESGHQESGPIAFEG
jgi:hypothetical protein